MQPFAHALACGTAAAVLASAAHSVRADDNSAPAYKLTVGRFQDAQTGTANDLNLRRSFSAGNAWLGYYNAPDVSERQWRLGADGSIDLGAVRLQPAGQLASHRYAAASLSAETGDSWFVGAGLGRTNLRPNVNLNFDPNDSWSLVAGWRGGGVSYQLQYIRDNRQNPDQRHLHLVWRQPLRDGQRLTVDLLHKQGLLDGSNIQRWGATVGYDWPAFFVRVARDPNVNFTPETQWRISGGARF